MGLELVIGAAALYLLAQGRGGASGGGQDKVATPPPSDGTGGGGVDVKGVVGAVTGAVGSVASIAATVAGALGGGGAAAAGTGGAVAAGGASGGAAAAAEGGAAAAGGTAAEAGAVAGSTAGGVSLGAAFGIWAALVAVMLAAMATGKYFADRAARWAEWTVGNRPGAKRRAIACMALSEWDLFEVFAIRLNPTFVADATGNNYDDPVGRTAYVPNFTRVTVSEIAGAQLGSDYVCYKPTLPPSDYFTAAGILAVCRVWAIERRWAYEQVVASFYKRRRGVLDVESVGLALEAGGFAEAVEEYCAAPSPTGIEPIPPTGFSARLTAYDTRPLRDRLYEAARAQLARIGISFEDFVRPARLDGQARAVARVTIDDSRIGEYFGQSNLQYCLSIFDACALGSLGWFPPAELGTRGQLRWLCLDARRELALDIQECQRLGAPAVIPASQVVIP